MSKMSSSKQPIRDFMQQHYTDARLSELLAHAQDGKLHYRSCCCFIGIPSADHPLQRTLNETANSPYSTKHYNVVSLSGIGNAAEQAFIAIGRRGIADDADQIRRRILIPMIRAEMWRRAKLRKVTMAATPETTHEPAAEHTKVLQGVE